MIYLYTQNIKNPCLTHGCHIEYKEFKFHTPNVLMFTGYIILTILILSYIGFWQHIHELIVFLL